jgi:parallel beta-helix repeat protein
MLEALVTIFLAANGALPEVTPTDDLVITESVRVKPGVYRIADEGEPGVLRVEGEGVVVVLDGVTIRGAGEEAEPDAFTGTGLVVTGKGNIVHGGSLRGFKVAVHVDGGPGHWLMGLDVSGNFAQRLRSTAEREETSDWLWPHRNDEGEWARNYGAGIWVRGAKKVRILDCRGQGSQNGILLDRAEGCVVSGADFSFNSGWGVALWRSSDNLVERSRFDWCVRGYSHGVYARGQDSAGILVFEQCHRNVFRENSATHSGDGFFLYAGHETTQRTGEGGSNDNLVAGNDFSHAVANGIEATFSTGNRFVDNRLDDCNYGIWAGYSRKSVFERNVIRNCTYAGIAIEHGSENVIRGNRIEDSRRGVWLWWDEDKEFLESVYGKKNRTDSADTLVAGNVIRGGEAALFLADSRRIRFLGNRVEGAAEAVVRRGECEEIEVEPAKGTVELSTREWTDLPGARRGRRHIHVHEWGPYDFRAARILPAEISGRRTARFRVLGASSEILILATKGEVEARTTRGPGGETVLTVTPDDDAGAYVPFTVAVEADGGKLTASGVLLNLWWTARFWTWEKDPREDPEAWRALLASTPLLERRVGMLDYSFAFGGPGGEVGTDRFATLAETEGSLPPGRYEVIVVSDDGVRVSIDGAVVLENWTHHGPTEDRAEFEVTEGPTRIRVEHFELDGYARLSFRLRKL